MRPRPRAADPHHGPRPADRRARRAPTFAARRAARAQGAAASRCRLRGSAGSRDRRRRRRCPPRLRSAPAAGYVGREPERERLDRVRGTPRARGGRGRRCCAGEPGIGKTRLADAHRAARPRRRRVGALRPLRTRRSARPTSRGSRRSAHLVEHAPADVLAAHVERHGGELQPLAPPLATRVPQAPPPRPTDPETERYLLFSAVVGLLEATSPSGRPVVLLLDDLHWADRPTLAVCSSTSASRTGCPAAGPRHLPRQRPDASHPLASCSPTCAARRASSAWRSRAWSSARHARARGGRGGPRARRRRRRGSRARSRRRPTATRSSSARFCATCPSRARSREADGRWALASQLEPLGLPQSVSEVVRRPRGAARRGLPRACSPPPRRSVATSTSPCWPRARSPRGDEAARPARCGGRPPRSCSSARAGPAASRSRTT